MKGASARRKKSQPVGLTRLARVIQKVEKDLNAKIDLLRGELRASETALAAERLRALNDGQVREGAGRLKSELQVLHDAGIIDRRGRRIRADPPAAGSDGVSDVV